MTNQNLIAEVFNIGPRVEQAAQTQQLAQELPAGYRCSCAECLDIDRWTALVLSRQEVTA